MLPTGKGPMRPGGVRNGEAASPASTHAPTGEWLARAPLDQGRARNGTALPLGVGPDAARYAFRSSAPINIDTLERSVNRVLERYPIGGSGRSARTSRFRAISSRTVAPPRVRFAVLDHLPVDEREPRLFAVLRADAIASIGRRCAWDIRVTLFVLSRLDHVAIVELPRPRIAAAGPAAARRVLASGVDAAFDAVVDALQSTGRWARWSGPFVGDGSLWIPASGCCDDARRQPALPPASWSA